MNKNSKTNLKKIVKEIRKHNKIVVLRHVKPDGDALGSQFGLENFLKLNFKSKRIKSFGLDNLDYLSSCFPKITEPDKKFMKGSLVFVVDTANKERISGGEFLNLASKVIKIDHHLETDKFGDINIVDTKAASATEILTKMFFAKRKYSVNEETALPLYIGMVTDTGRFIFPSTTSDTFFAASLLKEKIRDKKINDFYQTLSFSTEGMIRIKGKIMSEYTLSGKAAYYIAEKNFHEEFGVEYGYSSSLVNTITQANETKYALYSTWDNNNKVWATSLRSKDKPVNSICEKFGGGGHKLACGVKVVDKTDLTKMIDLLKKL